MVSSFVLYSKDATYQLLSVPKSVHPYAATLNVKLDRYSSLVNRKTFILHRNRVVY